MEWHDFLTYYTSNPKSRITNESYEQLCLICSDVEMMYIEKLSKLGNEAERNEVDVEAVGHHVFCDGSNWGRIAMYIVFVKLLMKTPDRANDHLQKASAILTKYCGTYGEERTCQSKKLWIIVGVTTLLVAMTVIMM